MTKDEIIELAKQVVYDGSNIAIFTIGNLQAFAKLVAEKEREACAKVCDVLAVHPEYASSITKLAAQAIRNRGQS